MGNNLCPIDSCNNKTAGKAVRRVNFCEAHKEVVIFIRDCEEIRQHEKSIGKSLWESKFLNAVNDVIRVSETEGFKVVGT